MAGRDWLRSSALAKHVPNERPARPCRCCHVRSPVPSRQWRRRANTVVAYEPVWAIGTGLTPTVADVAEAHAHIRSELAAKIGGEAKRIRILYGGSVKPSNAVELLSVANVDGALVGGASLKAKDFLGIVEAYLSF